MNKRNFLKIAGASALAAASWNAAADTYPDRPIHILVGYPAGGTSDGQIRALQEPLQRILGQPVVIENKTGASGAIATTAVARAKPDGYTLLLPTNIFVIGPNLIDNVGFDPITQFDPISLTSLTPLVLLVNEKVKATSVNELIALAKKNPGALTYGSAGASSYGRMATENFSKMAGIKMQEIPYQGVAKSTLALVSGEIQVLLSSPTATMSSYVNEGKLRLLGVASDKPSPLLPDAPLIGDSLPGFNAQVWSGLVAPAGTPPAIIRKLSDAVAQALATPEAQKRYSTIGLTPASSTPEAFAQRLKQEYREWGTLIKETGLKP
jgi:tripartite-type tricarboxylate transporter receptor subunit TctC